MRRKLIQGAGWSVLGPLTGRLIDMAVLLLLARMLTPADFGLTALALSIVSIIEMVVEVPLVLALTRLPSLERDHYDTAFTIGLMRGAVLFSLVLLAAWPFAAFYQDARLFPVAAAYAIAPVARSLYSPRMADQMRALHFAPVFVAMFSGKIIAAIATLGVLSAGGGYWAIATQSITSSVAASVISYGLAPYRPALSLAKFSAFAGFLGWFSLSQIMAAVSWQFDRFALGARLSKPDLGEYTMASDLSVIPTQSLIGPIMQPVTSAFSRLTGNQQQLRTAFIKAASAVMMIAAPICILIFATAHWITELVFSDAWTDVSVYLSWLSLTVLPFAYYQVFQGLALALGKTSAIFKASAIDLAARVLALPAGLILYSVMGVIAARGACAILTFMLAAFYAKKLIGVQISDQLRGLGPVALASIALTFVLVFSTSILSHTDWHPIFELALTALAGGSVYLGTLYALGALQDILKLRSSRL
jgi:PST family polysaccharide transporter